MPRISSYALQYSGVNFNSILSSTFDLFITEGAPLAPGGGFPALSDAQVGQLVAQGRTVVGYVNVCVTDDARYYWNASWTSNGQDTGTPIPGQAPSWLDQAVPLNFAGGHPTQDALIVEYWDAAWQQIVINQAVALVQRGYTGVFLDDVGRYYDAGIGSGTVALMADRMIDLIHAVRTAITAINPAAFIVTNTNPYIVTDNSGGTSGARSATYRADVDVHLIENQSATTLDHFATHFSGEPLLILQSVTPAPLTYDQAWSRGILYTAPNTSYNSLGTFAYPATTGADTLLGGGGPNQIDGLAGNDVLHGGGGDDSLIGGDGHDSLIGEDGGDYLSGGAGNDYLSGGAGIDGLVGGADADTLHGGADGDFLYGDDGGDTLSGDDGNDRLEGGAGIDGLNGGAGTDFLVGGADGDFLFGNDGGDTLLGEGGDDRLEGGAGIDGLSGDAGADFLTGGGDGDFLFGGDGVDTILGDDGNDHLDGGAGSDGLVGGAGADAFAFTAALGAGNVDYIADFSAADDTFILENAVFAGLAVGPLSAAAFVAASAAQDTSDRIVYNQATGQLYFDADGTGAIAPILFATLQGAPVLSAADFVVV